MKEFLLVLLYTMHRVSVWAVRLALVAALLSPGAALGVDLFSEDFEGVTLGPIVTYQTELRERSAWSPNFPAGWVADNSLMPGLGDPNSGVTEFEGWTVVDKNWWATTAGDQGRTGFLNGLGRVAVADSDEHDDFGTPNPQSISPFDATLKTPSIPLMGAAANTVNLSFHSSWMPETNQKATVTARYNNGTTVEVLRWHSPAADPMFHASAVNELVTLPLQNPAGAASVQLEFRLFDARNNWWWAVDNINVFTGGSVSTDGVLRAIVDRDTANVRIVNNTGETVNLRGYSLRSAAGAFNEGNATFQADSNPNWIQLTPTNGTNDLSEGHLSSAALPNAATINLGNNVWRKSFQDTGDISFSYLVNGRDAPIPGIVQFTGNNGNSFPYLDLNFNGSVEIGDWDTFRAGFPVSLAGLPQIQRYQLGDLDNDSRHTLNDYLVFKREYDAVAGAGAFEAALAARQVPEPATGVMLLTAIAAAIGVWCGRSRRNNLVLIPQPSPSGRGQGEGKQNVGAGARFLVIREYWDKLLVAVAVLMAVCSLWTSAAHAQLTLFSENFDSLPLGPSIEEAVAGDAVWTETPPAGWTVDDSGVPGINEPPSNNGKIEWAGWAFTDKTWWSTSVDGQLRETFNLASGTIMVADPDEWDDEPHPPDNGTPCTGDTVNPCTYDAYVTTPTFTIPAGIPAGRIKLAFSSSWRPEGNDDDANLFNDQRATVKAKYDGGSPVDILTWTSIQGAATFHPDAPNEAVLVDLKYNGTATSMSLTFGLDQAENDWWWAVDNIRVFVPADPSILRVNTTTGQVSIVGGDVIPTPINGISIESASGALNGAGLSGLSTSKPDSVDGPDADATVGNSSGETWQLLTATDNYIAEAFLHGDSVFTNSRNISLGNIFDTSTPMGSRDITFTYTTRFFDTVTGVVEYVSSPGVPGDYNSNGTVDAADYVIWKNSLGQSVTLPNDSTPGTVTQADYDLWRANFGKVASASGAAAAVPEPMTAQLLFMAVVLGGLVRLRRRVAASLVAAGAMAAGLTGSTAVAQLPPPPVLDRNYRFGDDPAEGASNGGTVTATFDSAGVPGMGQLIDLTAVGGPKYEALPTTSGGPVPRRPDNGTGLAIRLNPTATSQGQHLKTGFEQALNFPERSPSSSFSPGGTIDYEFIRDRGFQLWVLPQASGRADIVMDTNQHGALINASGNFAMRYINTDYDTGVPVIPNTWYHLMVVRPFGAGRGSIMYVNGRAVARAAGTYRGEDNPANEETTPLVIGANTGTGISPGLQNRFQGLVDDLEMFVMGLNSAKDYGEFIFERDNKYAAFFKPTNAADLTGDNVVNMSDVNVFVSNWLFQNTVGGLVVGDLTSRMKGDFNYDGFVNLSDWEILNELAPPGVGASALAMIQAIPEPATLSLAAIMAAVGLGLRRTRW